jgi:hypothetical protein
MRNSLCRNRRELQKPVGAPAEQFGRVGHQPHGRSYLTMASP